MTNGLLVLMSHEMLHGTISIQGTVPSADVCKCGGVLLRATHYQASFWRSTGSARHFILKLDCISHPLHGMLSGSRLVNAVEAGNCCPAAKERSIMATVDRLKEKFPAQRSLMHVTGGKLQKQQIYTLDHEVMC